MRTQREHYTSSKKVSALKQAISQNWLSEETLLAGFIDIDGVKETVRQLKASFPANFSHHFAVKANSIQGVLTLLKNAGIGAEVASPGELAQALRAGFTRTDIVFDEPAKSFKVIEHALNLGINLNIDNFQEFELICALAEKQKPEGNLGFRINPQIGAGSIKAMSTATKTSKFGVPIADEGMRGKVVSAYLENTWLNTIHSHVGSQGCPLPLMGQGIREVVRLVEEINAAAGHQQIKHINIGGGLTVNFDGEAVTPSFKDYADILQDYAPELFTGKYRVLTEFGRSIMAKNGFIASKVEYAKESGGRRIAITHAGSQVAVRTTFMPNAWPLRITAHTSSGELKESELIPQDIAGPCCFAGDLLGSEKLLPELTRNDYIMIHETGAYYFSNPFYYNSLPSPPVFGFKEIDGKTQLSVIREEQTIEQMMSVIG